MKKRELKFTPLAKQKFETILNGSKEYVSEFFDNINKYIETNDYKILFEGSSKSFYYKLCKKIYVIFTIEDDKAVGIIDFLTEIEFNRFFPHKN